MTIQDLLDNMDNWYDEERNQLRPVLDMLTGVSLETFQRFESGWDGESYEEFISAQNKVIRECIELEMSELGQIVREKLGYKPLTLDSVVG
jgi:hypothetical protein